MNPILSLALLLTLSASINAQDTTIITETETSTETIVIEEPTVCSCSPTVFTFVLSLDQTCQDNDIATNAGIDGSFCFTENDVAVPGPPVALIEEDDFATEPSDGVRVNATAAEPVASSATAAADDGPVRRRRLQDADPVTEIISVQFLEFDTSGDLTVINQDDTYADVSLADGDRLKFLSASSFLDTSLPLEDQTSSPALVPGGASLILYGKRESGEVVRNRFFFMYDMNCGRANAPVKVDDEIGWVTVSEISNAWPTFCPALPDNSPTIAPRSNEPTLTPSKNPTNPPSESPSAKPTIKASWIPGSGGSGSGSGSGDYNDHSNYEVMNPAFHGKSSKHAKHLKKAKASSKSSKSYSISSKSSKSVKSSKGSAKSSKVKGKSKKGGPVHQALGQYTVWEVERSSTSGAIIMSSGLCSVVSIFLASVLLFSRQ